jgi:hypothetical protein
VCFSRPRSGSRGTSIVAYLVLAHINAPQVVRLVRRLAVEPDAVVLVRYGGTKDVLPADAFSGFSNVHLVPVRGAVEWGGFGQVQAVLDCIETAFALDVPLAWMTLLSGQDYPCVKLADFHAMLARATVDGFIDHISVDESNDEENVNRYYFEYVRVPRGLGLGRLNRRLWRLNRLQSFVRFRHSRVGSFVGIADRRPFAQRTCYRGSFWWTLSRRSVAAVLDAARTQPELVRAYQRRLHPDESFFQTVLLADPSFRFASDDLHYIRFDDPLSGSPENFGTADLPAIFASGKPFARKFDTRVDPDVLDRIDAAIAGSVTPARG